MKIANQAVWGFGIVVVAVAAGSGYAYYSLATRLVALSSKLDSVTAENASTTAELKTELAQATNNLSSTLAQNVGAIQSQVGNLSGSLTNLQKLSSLDPELLKKYSKAYFLNENYVPKRLSDIPNAYVYSNAKELLFESDALPHLEAMIDAASSTGAGMYVDSAYRSFAEQRALKGDYTVVYGAGTANSFSADQGYSEHQLGTAVDLTAIGHQGAIDGFDSTPAYQWMLNNAYKYGFVLSYPKNNGYYIYEPWHWRFVGVKLATDLHTMNKNFYDLDQRTIDGYLIGIFDN